VLSVFSLDELFGRFYEKVWSLSSPGTRLRCGSLFLVLLFSTLALRLPSLIKSCVPQASARALDALVVGVAVTVLLSLILAIYVGYGVTRMLESFRRVGADPDLKL
jgi:hypothetical protein